ncbi:hypothetical protein KY290_005529 [Solanum tuberosum]|uniref:Uncharacterized protein n=1 Tax=Solanum tuberosum TaxID=4113 RepID=A0ABQ7WGV6_SOLTU|nr:hypothetical protein KY289_005917 [Solanum tuberosum]KAH0779102.1 hypothetical protein KY290_005529 [Solanum tuberosum]
MSLGFISHALPVMSAPNRSLIVDDSIVFQIDSRVKDQFKQILEEKSIEELRSKKKHDPIALQQVINNVNASGIKIVEGGNKRKAKYSDSKSNQSRTSDEVVSGSSNQDKSVTTRFIKS